MEYVILYNPKAANGHGNEKVLELKTLLTGNELTFKDLTTIHDMKEYIATLPEETYPIICGGDGTLFHLANSLGDNIPTKNIYYYPVGSGNDFYRDVAEHPDKRELVLMNRYLTNLPKVTVNGETYRFINGVGFGIDGYCCEVGDKLRETQVEEINYAGIAIKGLLFHFKPVDAHIQVDNMSYQFEKAWLAPTMHGRFYGGGMMATPKQDRLNADKTNSVMIFHTKGRIGTLMDFPSIFNGEHVYKKNVSVFSGSSITVEFDHPCALQIDGETFLNVSSYTVTNK